VSSNGIRGTLSLDSGLRKLQVLIYENRIELLPIESAQSMRGFLSGIQT
jgi:hypothetical protein